MSRPRLHIDYETFCDVNLLQTGSGIYSRRAVPILMGTKVNDDPTTVYDYHSNYNAGVDDFGDFDEDYSPKCPDEIKEAIKDGWWIVAHNAQFEFDVTLRSPALRHWPKFKPERIICTQAKARYWGIPDSLEEVGKVLALDTQKDKEGKRLIQKFCIPQKIGRAKDARKYIKRIDPRDPDWIRFRDVYNHDDVETEYLVDCELPDIPREYARIFYTDFRMNQRGFPVDIPGVKSAKVFYDHFYKQMDKRFKVLSKGLAPTQVAKIKEYLSENHDEDFDNLQSATIRDKLLEEDVNPVVREMLEIRVAAAQASVKKLTAFEKRTDIDLRARGGFLWYGAHTGRWCLTGDHEVLTPKGWKRLDEWAGGEIAVWNQTEEISFQKSTPNVFFHDGQLYHIKTARLDQVSTADHRMPGWSAHTGEFQVKYASALGRFCVPYTGTINKGSVLDADLLRVIVMTQADGHYATGGDVIYGFKKDRKVERCKALLRKAGIIFNVKSYNTGVTKIRVRRRHVPVFLRMFEDKLFGYWLLQCDLDVFFNELEHWDGYRAGTNSTQYSTSVYHNADIVRTLAHVSGRAGLLTEKKQVEGWKTQYNVSIWFNASNRHEIREKPKQTWDICDVYCPTTPTGFFLVRRNGKIWVTGNSGKGIQPQNFPRMSKALKSSIKPFFDWCECEPNLDVAELVYNKPLGTLACALKGFIKAEPGKKLYVADYAQIELRVLAWLAGAETTLERLRLGVDPYKAFAAESMYNCSVEEINEYQRQIAKSALLGAQYQIWIDSFIEYCKKTANISISKEEATNAILAYRGANPEIVEYWKDLEEAVIAAVETKGTSRLNNLIIRFEEVNEREWLRIYLPSGRPISYFEPKVSWRTTLHEAKDKEGNIIIGEDGAPVMYERTRKVFSFLTKYMGRIMREYSYGGKLCIAKNTPVLTNNGWKPIQSVCIADKVWDGESWVSHEGLVYKGAKNTIEAFGARMTADHEVLTTEGWVRASQSARYNRASCRLPNGYSVYRIEREKISLGGRMRLRNFHTNSCHRTYETAKSGYNSVMRMYAENNAIREKNDTWDVKASGICGLALDGRPMYASNASGLAQLRWKGDFSLRRMAKFIRGFLARYGADLQTWIVDRSQRQRRQLLQGKLPVGNNESASEQSPKIEKVFDILNCGPLRRFTVADKDGNPLIVHNCENVTQGVAADIMGTGLANAEDAGYLPIATVHDECVAETPEDFGSIDEFVEIMCDLPDCYEGLPIAAEGHTCIRYSKG